jgi:recombination protein RecT
MSVDRLKQATSEQTGIAKRESFPTMLEKMKPQIAMALPKHLNADRMCRIALTEFRRNPKLAECDPTSVVACVVMSAQMGWEIGVDGAAYIVPFGKTCTLVPGWKGYVDLVSRAGRATVWTQAVREGDTFNFQYGSEPRIAHQPGAETDDDSPFTHAYACGRVKGAEQSVIEVWSRAKVLKHLKRYNKVGNAHYALQNENNLEMYGRKVALLQVIKYMPKSVELQVAKELEYSAEAGAQTITIDEAVAGTFTPNGYDVEGETQEKRIDALFDKLDVPGDIRKEEIGYHEGALDALEAKLRAELEKAK